MADLNGLYLIASPGDNKFRWVEYSGGDDSWAWLQFCYDQIGCHTIDIVNAHSELPVYHSIGLIVDDEGLFVPDPQTNALASILYGSRLVGKVLIGFRDIHPSGDGDHVFPVSSFPGDEKVFRHFFSWLVDDLPASAR